MIAGKWRKIRFKNFNLSNGKKPNDWIKIKETTKLVEVLRYFVSHFRFTENNNQYVHSQEIRGALAYQFILLMNETILT